MKSEEKKQQFSLWGAKQQVLETELKSVKAKEINEGLNFSDDEDSEDEEYTNEEKDAKEKKKVVVFSAKANKSAARKERRDDQTANIFWNLRSKRNK